TWGDNRGGHNRKGVFYRLGVGRDGSVAYEVTNEFASVDSDKLKPDQEGIFLLRPDGKTLPLGEPSRDPSVRPRPTEDPNDQAVFTFDSTFAFSPDGRRIAFTERFGPSSKDEDPVQIWALAVSQ